MNQFRKLVFLFLIQSPMLCLADVVELQLDQAITVTADYRAGSKAKPLVIVLHGFLQTYQFQATKNIIDGLAANNHAVLGPNLSLGVNRRKKSLECEAIHTHTLQSDLAEIRKWLQWGRKQGYRKFLLVGHSWGSHHILALMEHEKHNIPGLIGTILVSLTPVSDDRLNLQIEFAKKRKKSKQKLAKYQLGFCRSYTSVPNSFLSYAQWTDKRAINSLQKMKSLKIKNYIVLGSKDKRINHNWTKKLNRINGHIHTINGANHFFSSVYEFDLVDKLTSVIMEMSDKT